MNYKLFPLAATAAIFLAGCSNDEVMEMKSESKDKPITFSVKVSHSTRATETTPDNLGHFYVFGKSVHPDGYLYNAFLIGSAESGTATPELVTRNDETSGEGTTVTTYNLDRQVFLPNGIDNAVFWAFTDLKKDETAAMPSGTITFDNNNGPQIKDYISPKADLTTSGIAEESGSTSDTRTVWADGSGQKDLVSAFGSAKVTDSHGNNSLSSNIILNFKHMLSKITIKAAQKSKTSKDHRIVKIKGAWIVNAYRQGQLSAGYSNDSQNDNPQWKSWETPTTFGTYFSTPHELSSKSGLTEDDYLDLTSQSLMLIPQNVNAWDKNSASSFSETKTAYIMLLCRVELKHTGATHTGGGDDDIFTDGTYHYHQQFPVNANQSYDADEYGLTCIPIKIQWEKGKRYTLYLDICGLKSGAGYYPPTYTEDDIEKFIPDSEITGGKIKVLPVPNGKVGELVLDAPINFDVRVSDWEDEESSADKWNNGTIHDY